MPLFWLSLAFLLGIFLASILPFTWRPWAAGAGLGLIVLFVRPLVRDFLPGLSTRPAQWSAGLQHRLSPRLRRFAAAYLRLPPAAGFHLPLAALLLAVAFGGWRYATTVNLIDSGHVAWYIDPERRYVVEGVLVRPPDERDARVSLVVSAERLRPRADLLFTPVRGNLAVSLLPGTDWQYGDRVRLEGSLVLPAHDEEFSYRTYLARQEIFVVMERARALRIGRGAGNPLWATVYAFGARALERVYQIWPDPEASLLAGILLGNERGISPPVAQAFQATGTTHIIAISGFNMAILAGLFMTLFGRLLGRPRRFLAAGLSTLVLAVYTLLVGANPAVVRAAIMGTLTVFAAQFGRRQNGLNTLAFVAALMALANPYVLWDAGFQLSFMATLGLMLYAGPMSTWFFSLAALRLGAARAERLTGPVGEYLLFTLAAQLTTLPVTLYHFGRVSLSSLFANPLILPAQPPVMVLGGAALLLGLLSQPLGQLAGLAVWPFVAYTIRTVEWLGSWPAGSFAIAPPSLMTVVVFYLLLFGWTYIRANSPTARPPPSQTDGAGSEGAAPHTAGQQSPLSQVPILAVLGMLAVIVWRTALAAPDGRLHLWVLDVGSGEGLLVRTPGGRYILIDGGESPAALSDPLGRLLSLVERPPFRRAALDWLVVAATDPENIGALPRTLERFPPEQVLWAGSPGGSYPARELYRSLARSGIPVTTAQPGQALDLGAGARLDVLAVTARGSVLLLEWDGFRALLPVGLDFSALERLTAGHGQEPVQVLLLAEDGYSALCPPEWVEFWQPQIALQSADAETPLATETLTALDGVTILQTGRRGTIHLSTDGRQLWVEAEKP